MSKDGKCIQCGLRNAIPGRAMVGLLAGMLSGALVLTSCGKRGHAPEELIAQQVADTEAGESSAPGTAGAPREEKMAIQHGVPLHRQAQQLPQTGNAASAGTGGNISLQHISLQQKLSEATAKVTMSPQESARLLREVFTEDLYSNVVEDKETGGEAYMVSPQDFGTAMAAFSNLARQAPAEAANILTDDSIPFEVTPELLSAYVEELSGSDPETAAESINAITGHDLRQQAIFAYSAQLLQSMEPEKAISALEQAGITYGEDARQYVYGALSEAQGSRWQAGK